MWALELAGDNPDIARRILELEGSLLELVNSAAELLKALPVRTAIKLIQQPAHATSALLMDLFLMHQEAAKNKWYPAGFRVRNWRDWHNKLARIIAKNQEDMPLKVDPRIEPLDGAQIGDGWELRAPKSAAELARWGEAMQNCIGAYAHRVNKGLSLILGLFRQDEIKYGIELDESMRVCQFSGFRNEEAPRSLQERVREVLTSKKTVVK